MQELRLSDPCCVKSETAAETRRSQAAATRGKMFLTAELEILLPRGHKDGIAVCDTLRGAQPTSAQHHILLMHYEAHSFRLRPDSSLFSCTEDLVLKMTTNEIKQLSHLPLSEMFSSLQRLFK